MRLTLPRFSDIFDGRQLRQLVVDLESAFSNVVEDKRRGAITVTSDYTLVREDSLVLVAPVASATVNITVPAVADWMITQKWEWECKLIAAGTMTLTPVSGTIEGTTDATTSIVQTSLAFRATPDGWKIV
jgi:hypothetical protein